MSSSPSWLERIRVPHTLVLLLAMVVLALLCTYIFPQGQYERVTTEAGHTLVKDGSYALVAEPEPVSPLLVLTSIPRGLADSKDIIFFCFIIGGAVAVVRRTGTIDAVLGWVLERFGKRPGMLIAMGVTTFAIGSSTLGMSEEYLPLIPLLIALCAAMRMDAVTAVGIVMVGCGVGYGAAAINPFTVVIAQEIAGLEPTSGAAFRVALLLPFLAVGIHHVWRYAKRVRDAPESSLVAGLAAPADVGEELAETPRMTGVHLAVVASTLGCIVLLVFGIAKWHWYLEEMSAMFIGLTIWVGIIGRLSADETAVSFCKGAAELTTTALLIGFARAVKIVLEDGLVIDTIIHGIAQPLAQMGPYLAAVGMFGIQSVLNFFIPSGSGQAYVTMPIMAPLADLTGVSRQVSVLAYQFGDGFTNMMIPTNAILVGMLGMAGIPFDRWLRFILPLMVKVWILGSIALMVAVAIGFS